MHSLEPLIARQIHRWNSMLQAIPYHAEGAGEGAAAGPIVTQHPCICISRDLGSGARVVAQFLCDRLGYELFGKRSIDALARDLKVQRRLIESLDEHRRGWLELMIDSLVRGREIDASDYARSLARVVQTLALQGGVVLLGRGASFILREKSALNVMLTAPLPFRVRRVMDYQHLSEAEAEAVVHESDRDRAAFVRQHFGANVHDLMHYDLAINMARFDVPEAAELILDTLRRRGYGIERLRIPEEAMAAD